MRRLMPLFALLVIYFAIPVKAVESATKAKPGCACSGSKYCTGPRGGKYCITASGKKRYAKR